MQTILTFSGGLDSTALLCHLMKQGHHVRCLSVDYGQRHRRELEAAARICDQLGVEHRVADLTGIGFALAGSSQTSDIPVPEGHYTAPSMAATVVPNRNMILLSVATAWAVATKSEAVAYAAHCGDHAIYPDCREGFAAAMSVAVFLANEPPVRLIRPFIDKTKADIVRLGAEIGAPFAMTYSCYNGREHHCGKCGTCYERREAFELAGVSDPTEYEA